MIKQLKRGRLDRVVGTINGKDLRKFLLTVNLRKTASELERIMLMDVPYVDGVTNLNVYNEGNDQFQITLWTHKKRTKKVVEPDLELKLDSYSSFKRYVETIYPNVPRNIVRADLNESITHFELVGYQYMDDDGNGPFFTEVAKGVDRYLAHWPVFRIARSHDCNLGQGNGYGVCSKCKAEGLYGIHKPGDKLYLHEA